MTEIEIVFELLNADHNLASFSCGDDALDSWLHKKALRNQKLNATRTFLALDKRTGALMGYYGLSMSEIIRTDAPKSVQRNMPASIPVILLGRLAISRDYQNIGLGRYVMRHAIGTCVRASENIAARMIVTQPIDENARAFYLAVGFEPLAGRDDAVCLDLRKMKDTDFKSP